MLVCFQLDSLHPALLELERGTVRLLTDPSAVVKAAGAAAAAGAEATKKMKAKAGRASYVAADKVTKVDPGAAAVAAWFGQIADTLA